MRTTWIGMPTSGTSTSVNARRTTPTFCAPATKIVVAAAVSFPSLSVATTCSSYIPLINSVGSSAPRTALMTGSRPGGEGRPGHARQLAVLQPIAGQVAVGVADRADQVRAFGDLGLLGRAGQADDRRLARHAGRCGGRRGRAGRRRGRRRRGGRRGGRLDDGQRGVFGRQHPVAPAGFHELQVVDPGRHGHVVERPGIGRVSRVVGEDAGEAARDGGQRGQHRQRLGQRIADQVPAAAEADRRRAGWRTGDAERSSCL